MRIIVFSDSHGSTYSLDEALYNIGKFDAIVHLGDIASDVEYLEAVYSDVPIYSVVGNNDFFASGDHEKTITIDGYKIFIAHGHTLGVHIDTERLVKAAKREGASAALFGHTHRAMLEYTDGILILNPGSTSRPRSGKPSFAVIETDKKLDAVIVDWML